MIWLPVVGNYADIDVYASIIAYANLLNQRSKPAKTYIPVIPNYSVPNTLRLSDQEGKAFDFQPEDQAIILDISDPDAINQLVADEQILELIDHHPGYENYWRERIGKRVIIEPIGAVATSIFEWWGECWDYKKMSPSIAKLLLGAILDNTLNFNAKITTGRDRKAATKLAEIAKTTLADFTTWYFSAVSDTITANLQDALLKDCKVIQSPVDNSTLAFYQLALWDATGISSRASEVINIARSRSLSWLVSIISISEKKNYILTSSSKLAEYFSQLLKLHSQGNWLVSSQLHLRKEIINKIIQTR